MARGGFHSSGSHNFAFHRGGDHFVHHHDGDHFFHRHDRFFFGFGYPFYGYPDYYYPYDYGYYDYSGAPSDDQYWSDLTAAVQTELARDGYYHGAIDGVVCSAPEAPTANKARASAIVRAVRHRPPISARN